MNTPTFWAGHYLNRPANKCKVTYPLSHYVYHICGGRPGRQLLNLFCYLFFMSGTNYAIYAFNNGTNKHVNLLQNLVQSMTKE